MSHVRIIQDHIINHNDIDDTFQNIDGLETLTGLPGKKVGHAHGSFTAASCIVCGERRNLDEVKNEVLNDDVPMCAKCGGESIRKVFKD